jgi:diadenosine tetraphosphatase ApaH/serine/threonine PP2A family protein phosphatase
MFLQNGRVCEEVPSIAREDLRALLNEAKSLIVPECSLIQGPVVIVSNLHGRLADFKDVLLHFGLNIRYLILGNFVGVGEHSIETACFLLALRLHHPDHFFLLRGAQECCYSNRLEPFFVSCVRTYSLSIWRLFCEAFQRLPVAALVDECVLCTPGGLSPRIRDRRDLNIDVGEIPETGIAYDLLFSEPNPLITKWADSKDQRSFAFGRAAGEKVCRRLGVQIAVFGTKDLAPYPAMKHSANCDGTTDVVPPDKAEDALKVTAEEHPSAELFGEAGEGQVHFWRLFSARKTRAGNNCQASVLVIEDGVLTRVFIDPPHPP